MRDSATFCGNFLNDDSMDDVNENFDYCLRGITDDVVKVVVSLVQASYSLLMVIAKDYSDVFHVNLVTNFNATPLQHLATD